MKKPTRYQWLQAVLWASGASALFLSLALIEWTPPGMLRALALILCGANFSGLWYNWVLMASYERDQRMRDAYESLHIAFVKLRFINRALAENRIVLEQEGEPSVH
jgi:hypothetical protein